MLASLTLSRFLESIFLVKTNDECKYKLWGIITAPTRLKADYKAPLGIVGTKVP